MGSQGLTDNDAQQQEEEAEKRIDNEKSADYSSSSCVVRWERFLSKMVVRVLLVEADDSTRQIIAALLRKCSYRVAAVGDGLKAWELLKGRPEKIDLILTEVELPSISGYALLTLIMEHHVCKNIPVIMMSSQDSISTVYKCMLRGATDFLVKPIRKNELRNLWQHLWRKQSSSNCNTTEPGIPKVEATAENIEETHIATNEERNLEVQGLEFDDSRAEPNINASSESAQGRDDEDSEMIKLACENSSMEEAIDLIGTFDKGRSGDVISIATSSEFFYVSKLLDLSLKSRSNPTDQNNDERHRLKLNHSDASAFSWYVNKPHQPNNSMSPGHNPETDVATIIYQKHHLSPCSSQQPDHELSTSHQDHNLMDQSVTGEVDKTDHRQGHDLEDLIDQGRVSPAHDQSGNKSNLCDENTSIHQSNLYSGNNGKINVAQVNEEGFQVNDDRASSRRSLLREAALKKFRLKRKDRCFEKKVRYESRKKLAEKRPRVKGQFVRQVPNDHPQHGNSSSVD